MKTREMELIYKNQELRSLLKIEEDRVQRLRATVLRLEEQLEKFANHLPNCMVNHRGTTCDCGYDQVKDEKF